MDRYVIANQQSGEILRVVVCTDQSSQQAGEGEVMLKHGTATQDTHWVSNLTVTPYTPAQAAAKTARPDPGASWSNLSMSWLDTRTLQQIRDARWDTIKDARAAATLHPIMGTPYGDVDADEDATSNVEKTLAGWRSARDIGQDFPTVDWTMADNSVKPLTYLQLATISVLLLSRGEQAFVTARTLRAAIDSATTPEAVQAVDWPS